MYDLTGKKALVTGGGRGIGAAIAKRLAACGAEVFILYAGNTARAEATKSEIEAAGGKCSLIMTDLCKPDGADGVINQCGGVDILVLNASIQIRNKWEQITAEEFNSQVNCNFYSSLCLMQQAVPLMREKKWGRIVAIGSVQEAKPHPDMLIYSATKAAQTNMVKSLSLQVAKEGITVNNVAPGVIYTDRNFEALSDPAYAKIVADSIPVGFYGAPEDCAGMVALLCSDEGRYITGQSIYVDGGKSL